MQHLPKPAELARHGYGHHQDGHSEGHHNCHQQVIAAPFGDFQPERQGKAVNVKNLVHG